MVILKAIGAFFVKIWRWIKETAWVQPLLIVGAIFAIIFSIPYFTQWIQSLQGESSGSFFALNQKSLEGETIIENLKEANLSDADKLTKSINDMNSVCIKWNDSNKESKEADELKKNIKNEFNKSENKSFGEKYFLVFTSDNNSNCTTVESGFRYLSNEWSGIFAGDTKGSEFKFYSINISEKSSNDKDYKGNDDKKAFYRYLTNWTSFFNTAGPALKKAPYCVNKNLGDNSNYEAFSRPSYTEFVAPTILLIDYTQEAIDQQRAGVSEVVFGIEGDNDVRRAQYLLNMWNHCNKEADNQFSLYYAK